MLKRMQGEIEALTQRWMITEEKLKSGENMYHMISRAATSTTSNFIPASHHKLMSMTNYRSAKIINPSPGTLNTLVGTRTTNDAKDAIKSD
jgi:hypothetical protein